MTTVSQQKISHAIDMDRARKFCEETAVMCTLAADTPHDSDVLAALKTLRKMSRLLRSLEVAGAKEAL